VTTSYAAHPAASSGAARAAEQARGTTRSAGAADTTKTAVTAVTAARVEQAGQQATGSTGATGPTESTAPASAAPHDYVCLSASPTGTTSTEQAAGPAGPPSAAGGEGGCVARAPVAADATVTEQQPAGPTRPAGTAGLADSCARTTGPAGPTGAEQPGRPTVAAVLTIVPGSTGAPAAEQQAPGPTVLPRAGSRVGAVSDQRPPQQCLGRRIDRGEQILFQGLQRISVGGLGERIRPRAGGQGLHKPVVKGRSLRAERLKLLGVIGKKRRNRGRHLVFGRGKQRRGSRRRHRLSFADCGADAG
jgi:hypothetical protein